MGNVSAQEPVKEQIKPQSMRAPAVLLFLMGGGEKKIMVVSPLQGYGDWL